MMRAAPKARRLTQRVAGIKSVFFVGAVLLAFFTLWLTDLGYPSLSSDESFVAILSTRSTGEILQRLNSDEPHPPVYYLIMHAWQFVAGNRPELSVRYPSLFVGVLLLALVYCLGRELGMGRWTALIPMIVVGFGPQMVLHLREARMYGPMVMSVALIMLIALRFERPPQRAAFWIAVGATALPLFTHYFTMPFVGVIGVWRWWTLRGASRRRWLASQVVAWIGLAVWLPLLGRGFFNPTSLSQGKTWSLALPPWDTLAGLIKVGVFGYRDTPDLWIVLLGGGLLLGGWLIGALQSKRSMRGLLVLGVIAPLMAYAVLCWVKPLYHPKYALPWLLFAALAIGGLAARRPRLGSGVTLALLIVMLIPMWRTVRRPYEPGLAVSPDAWLQPRPRQLSERLTELFGPTDIFGLGTPDPTLCYYADHYFDRQLGCALIPQYSDQTAGELGQQLTAMLKHHTVLWYLDYYNPAWDPRHVADAAFAQVVVNLGNEDISGNRLRLYAAPETFACAQRQVGTRFGQAAELIGVWGVGGNALHVALNWRALVDQPAIDAKVFVHVVDNTGQTVTQDDSVPVNWTRPLTTWRRDEQVLDFHTLSLPTSAAMSSWSIRIGLYDTVTGARLPALDRSGTRLLSDAVALPLADVLSVAACAQ